MNQNPYWLFNQYKAGDHLSLGDAQGKIAPARRLEAASKIPHGWRIVKHGDEFAFSRFTAFSNQYVTLLSLIMSAESILRGRDQRRASTLFGYMTGCAPDCAKSRATLIYELLQHDLGSSSVCSYTGFDQEARVIADIVNKDCDAEDRARQVAKAIEHHRDNPEAYLDNELVAVHAHTATPTFTALTAGAIECAVEATRAAGYPTQLFSAVDRMRSRSKAYLAFYLSLNALRVVVRLLHASGGDAQKFVELWKARCATLGESSNNASINAALLMGTAKRTYDAFSKNIEVYEDAERKLSEAEHFVEELLVSTFILLRSMHSVYSEFISAWDDSGVSCIFPLHEHFNSSAARSEYATDNAKRYLCYFVGENEERHGQIAAALHALIVCSNSAQTQRGASLQQIMEVDEDNPMFSDAGEHVSAFIAAAAHKDGGAAYEHAQWLLSNIDSRVLKNTCVLPIHGFMRNSELSTAMVESIVDHLGAGKGFSNPLLVALFGSQPRAEAFANLPRNAESGRSPYDYLLAPDSFWGGTAFDEKLSEDLNLL